jgi:hypothetical protein
VTVPRKSAPKLVTYSDGEGGTLTQEQWDALPPAKRERIQKLVDDHIKRIVGGGIA